MVYRVIGLMSGSSLDGLDIVLARLTATGGSWQYEITAAACHPYEASWKERLKTAAGLSARDYLALHSAYGHYIGEEVNRFIDAFGLHYQAGFIASHGHTVFHFPAGQSAASAGMQGTGFTAQIGDGAAIAAVTGLPVISDLRSMDVALRGQGAPIVPAGEKYLFPDYDLLLNIGGIANISFHHDGQVIAFDVCPANRVLNELAGRLEKEYDEDGRLAAGGMVQEELLQALNSLGYYGEAYPKSLANEFGTEIILPLLDRYPVSIQARLRTYTEHIAVQVAKAAGNCLSAATAGGGAAPRRMLITGGGAFNGFLIRRIRERLAGQPVEIVIPDASTVQYKEALIMAFLGALRWRQENTALASVTGATRDSIGGALWMGQEY